MAALAGRAGIVPTLTLPVERGKQQQQSLQGVAGKGGGWRAWSRHRPKPWPMWPIIRRRRLGSAEGLGARRARLASLARRLLGIWRLARWLGLDTGLRNENGLAVRPASF